MLNVAIAGATGYAGGEALRLLGSHPQVRIGTLAGHSSAGDRLGVSQAHLRQFADRIVQPIEPADLGTHDAVILAVPHGQSAAISAAIRQTGSTAILIDCGADHRLEDPVAWAEFYGGEHPGSWPYGLPELPGARAKLQSAREIAVPGCYPTSVSLALAPALAAGLVHPEVVAVCASGTSGAGKAAKSHLMASEVMGSAGAYGVGGSHRHTPEMVQNLSAAAGVPVTVSFTPVLVPMARGILSTVSAPAADDSSLAALRETYQAAYADEPFVHLLPEGELPSTAMTLGANTCLLQVAVDRAARRVVVIAALDNLVKGTAGAAVQCLNLAAGLSEATGLGVNAVAP